MSLFAIVSRLTHFVAAYSLCHARIPVSATDRCDDAGADTAAGLYASSTRGFDFCDYARVPNSTPQTAGG